MLEKIPDFVFLNDIEPYLTIYDLFSLSLSSRYFSNFLNNRVSPTKLLLNAVAQSKLELCKKILSSKPHLMIEYDFLIDHSKRYFPKVSAFQYTIWALDTQYMLPMMYECIPKTFDGEQLRLKVEEQLYLLKKNTIEYLYEGMIFRECHFQIVGHLVKQQIKISAMQFFIGNRDLTNIERCALNFFRKHQELPVHVIDHHWNKNIDFILKNLAATKDIEYLIKSSIHPESITEAGIFLIINEANLKDLIGFFIQNCNAYHKFEKTIHEPFKYGKESSFIHALFFNIMLILITAYFFKYFQDNDYTLEKINSTTNQLN